MENFGRDLGRLTGCLLVTVAILLGLVCGLAIALYLNM